MTEFSDIVGKTFSNVEVNKDNQEIIFFINNVRTYVMYHEQDCCESVTIEDIVGDIKDLIGNPILSAEEVSNIDDPSSNKYAESYTWTYYKASTIKGSVTIRWYGESNGYYSEGVYFDEVKS